MLAIKGSGEGGSLFELLNGIRKSQNNCRLEKKLLNSTIGEARSKRGTVANQCSTCEKGTSEFEKN